MLLTEHTTTATINTIDRTNVESWHAARCVVRGGAGAVTKPCVSVSDDPVSVSDDETAACVVAAL